MTVECIACVHLSRKETPRDFRDLGLLRCLKDSAHRFFSPSFPRDCDRFRPADPNEVEMRREWIAKRPSVQPQNPASGAAEKAAPCSTSSTSTKSP